MLENVLEQKCHNKVIKLTTKDQLHSEISPRFAKMYLELSNCTEAATHLTVL